MPVPLLLTLLAAVTLPRFVPRRNEQSRLPETISPSSFRSFDPTTGLASFGNRSDGIVGSSFGSFGLGVVCTRRQQVQQRAHLLALRAQKARSSFGNSPATSPAASHVVSTGAAEFVRYFPTPGAARCRHG